MDKFIQDIVAVDKECALRVEEANQRKHDVQTSMNEKRKELYNTLMTQQQVVIENHKLKLQEEINATKLKNQQEFEDSIAMLKGLYESHKDTWIETIVKHCKEI